MLPARRAPARLRPELKRQARRELILDTAVAAFREKGFAGTSMRDIALALAMTKGNLYYYFPDKEEILFRCHERALLHILDVARGVRRRHSDPAAALRELIEQHVGIMVHEFHGTALALELGHLTGRRLERIVALRDRYERIVRTVLREGMRAGAFRDADLKLTSFAILGGINWIARWYRPSGGTPSEVIGRTFADLFVRALRPDRRRPGGRRAGSGRRPTPP